MKKLKFVVALIAAILLMASVTANAQWELPQQTTIAAGTGGDAISDLIIHSGIGINPAKGFLYHVSVEDTGLFSAGDASTTPIDDSVIVEIQTRPAVGYPGASNTLNWVGTYRDTITMGGAGRRMTTQDGWAGVGSGFCKVMTGDSSAMYGFAGSVRLVIAALGATDASADSTLSSAIILKTVMVPLK